jgi:hypothetical protein
MPVVPLPIANGFYLSDSLPISAQECTNWYPNIVQTQGLQQETLFGTPGIIQVVTTGEIQQVNRGAKSKAGILYEVNGDTLYVVNQVFDGDGNESFISVSLGTVEGSGRVSMAENGTQLMILVPGGKGYIYNEAAGTPFEEITDVNFTANGNPQYVIFLDGYFVITTDTKEFIISALNNGLSYNALDSGTAESDPDSVVAPIVDNNQLSITGTVTSEAFENVPSGADFPFQRNGLFIDKGVFAAFSLINTDEGYAFIGGGENESPAIWEVIGNGRRKISTTAIDSILQDFTEEEIQDSFALSYAQKGAYFIAFSLPTTTLFLDTVSGRWHERKSQVVNEFGNTEIRRWRVNSVTKAYGRVFVGDSVDGRIGILDPDVYTEYGNTIIRTIATQPFFNNNKSLSVPSLELIFESGVGNAEVPDPKIRLATSSDGKKYGDERIRSMGKVGEFERRGIWNRNGRYGRFTVFKFILSEPVKPVIIGLTANIIGGNK